MKNGSRYLLSFLWPLTGCQREKQNADGWYCLVGLNIIYSTNIDFGLERIEENLFVDFLTVVGNTTEKKFNKNFQVCAIKEEKSEQQAP